MTTHRFLRVHRGVTDFAEVGVDASSNGTVAVLCDCRDAEWREAAVAGAEAGLAWAKAHGCASATDGVSITAIVGTDVDTTSGAVRVAAEAAARLSFSSAPLIFSDRPPWTVG